MVRATLISTDGPYLEAMVEVDGRRYCIMDELGVGAPAGTDGSAEFGIEFDALLDDDEEWGAILSSNPERRVGLEPIQGWRYRAFGKVIQVAPVIVDCGLLRVEGVVTSSDPALIGEPVSFTVSRLSGRAVAI